MLALCLGDMNVPTLHVDHDFNRVAETSIHNHSENVTMPPDSTSAHGIELISEYTVNSVMGQYVYYGYLCILGMMIRFNN